MLLTWVRFRCKFVGKVGQFSVQLNTEHYVASSGDRRILVIGKEKQKIRNQLEALGISKGSVYPEIERVAEFIKASYMTPAKI